MGISQDRRGDPGHPALGQAGGRLGANPRETPACPDPLLIADGGESGQAGMMETHWIHRNQPALFGGMLMSLGGSHSPLPWETIHCSPPAAPGHRWGGLHPICQLEASHPAQLFA